MHIGNVKRSIVVLTVIVRNSSLVLLLSKQQQSSFMVVDVEIYESQSAIIDGFMYNWEHIIKHINSFIKKNLTKPRFLTVVLDSKQIAETFLFSAVPLPQEEIITPGDLLVTYTAYIGPYPDTDHLLYRYRCKQAALLQAHLLAHILHIPLVTVTNTTHALLYAYRAVKKEAFRRAELAKDLIQSESHIERLFTQDIIHRLVTGNVNHHVQHANAILMAYGHFFYERLRT